MPLHDLKCPSCGLLTEALLAPGEERLCVDCNVPFVKLPSTPMVHKFHAGWYEHITSKPLYIQSKKELKAACKKYGVTSVYLADS